MDNFISKKITIISLICMIMIIYIHSYNIVRIDGKLFFQPSNTLSALNIFLQNFISEGIARTAVPIFFVVSGYLFFNNFTIKTYKQKITKRFYTLFIPYLFWSIIAVFIYFVLQSVPGVQHFFKNTLIINYTFPELIDITWVHPRNFPLWFLRDLMLLVIISPIIYYLVNNFTKLFFLITIILWFVIQQTPAELSYYKSEPILFFSLGAYISLINNDLILKRVKRNIFSTIFVLYVTLLLFKTVLITFFTANNILVLFTHKITIIFGIVFFWLLLDRYLINNKYLWLMSNYTFLYYVFHEPGLKILQNAFYGIIGRSSFSSMISYIILPVFMLFFLTMLGILMKKMIPKTTQIITGNRL